VNGRRVRPFPDWLAEVARAAVRGAYGDDAARAYRPDATLVNHYRGTARLGMHQDNDELTDDPVVSLSVGDSCTFRFGTTENRGRPYTHVRLASGDAFVFGRASRWAYHGVPTVFPDTAPLVLSAGPHPTATHRHRHPHQNRRVTGTLAGTAAQGIGPRVETRRWASGLPHGGGMPPAVEYFGFGCVEPHRDPERA
jgi:alkylated DNA repair protein (DNA oxidative demethylase)